MDAAQPTVDSFKSAHSKCGLPCQTVVYCLREHRSVSALLPNGEVRTLINESFRNGIPLTSPYGLALSTDRGSFWIADKHTNSLWFTRIEETFDSSEQRYSMLDATRHDLTRFGLYGPCMLDAHPEFGLLVGCYGNACPGGLGVFDGEEWRLLTSLNFRDAITHCCWLENGAYCYVSRNDSILYLAETIDGSVRPLTLDGKERLISSDSGSLCNLRLRYVQGLSYSRSRRILLIADANLGAIFEVNLEAQRYRVIAGRPTFHGANHRAGVLPGNKDVWLGAIRAIAEDSTGCPIWLDGENGQIWRLNASDEVQVVGRVIPGGKPGRVLGCGMIVVGENK